MHLHNQNSHVQSPGVVPWLQKGRGEAELLTSEPSGVAT
jgi:hypothetical protein